MYQRNDAIPELTARVNELLEREDLTAPLLAAELARIEALTAEDWIPHGIATPAYRDGEKMMLRLLIWDDEDFDQVRAAGIDVHAKAFYAAADSSTLNIPEVRGTGSDPLRWDLTHFIEGTHLPFDMSAPDQLSSSLKYVPNVLRAMYEISKMQIDGVQPENWQTVQALSSKYFEWASNKGFITEARLDALSSARDEFLDHSSPDRQRLVHPDLHIGNLFFPSNDETAVIDWDNAVLGDEAFMYARHWVIMSHERAWSRQFLLALRETHTDPTFWRDFMVHAAYRGFDQCELELERSANRPQSLDDLQRSKPDRAGIVTRTVAALDSLMTDLGLPAPLEVSQSQGLT